MARIHYKKAYLQINKYHQKEKVSYSVDQVATSIYIDEMVKLNKRSLKM